MGPNEPIWRSNTSYSPPSSTTWDYQLQTEELRYEFDDGGGIVLDDSSSSSSSKGSRSWIHGEQVLDHRYSASNGGFSYFNSPSDSYLCQQLMPPPAQGVIVNDYFRESSSTPQTFTREGTSRVPESDSFSSQSDDSEYEPASKTHASSHRSFSSCCSFMSKPIHPFSSSEYNVEGEESFSDISIPSEAESFFQPKNVLGGSRCNLCERFLSQRSPWGARRIILSGDLPISSVLSCWHVYHAECLERITPKPQKLDPPCPVCEKFENGHRVEQWAICRLKNGLPRLRSLGDEGTSRVWSCGKAGDCVERAVDVPKMSSGMLLRDRGRSKRQLSFKKNLGKERAENSKRSGLCSSLAPGPALKRW
ncbi:uncharacterized protein A4U43_C03F16810 [Asparagus officinalis]|uniref:RING-type domain-containing protein n=2 Tax=Asparagus officinalis TaxID=4686 RepID=A0A5P1FAP1_ASPOF|nr:uncharacterized protein A4U43_C03F16810 [Asparagus officinalis]